MIVAQREIGDGLQEAVEIDRDRGVVRVLAGPWEEPGAKPKDPPIRYSAADPVAKGDRVMFQGAVYESLIDANTWSPTDYPAGWKRV